MTTLPLLEDEMYRLVAEARRQGIFLRLLGGLAIKQHCNRAPQRALMRESPDIDFATQREGAPRLAAFLRGMGYTPNKTFNTLSGDQRQLYYDTARNRQVDIFIGDFAMCHKLPLSARLNIEPLTIPLAELFLTKAQIVQLNRKDVLDLLALLLDHEVGPADAETINSAYIAALCAKDWGLYTTVNLTIAKLRAFVDTSEAALLTGDLKKQVHNRLDALQAAMTRAPKPFAWQVRAKVGTRVPWYAEVEEVQRGNGKSDQFIPESDAPSQKAGESHAA
jgi:hypothetical protein